MQGNEEDKAWQISRMYNIYKSSTVCIVLPGGMQRLIEPEGDESVTWIQRSWTLQEVLAPLQIDVLFSWKYGKCLGGASSSAAFYYDEVIKDESAACSLKNALSIHTGSMYELVTERKKFKNISFELFGRGNREHVETLLCILEAGEEGTECKEQAIWRSSFMRTCSYPADAVFSIMGLFGVTLDPRRFNHGDRRGATIALAQEILKNGGRASWLASGLHLPACDRFSSFPLFPSVQSMGQATLATEAGDRPVAELLPSITNGWLDGVPTGTMDDAGCFTFASHAAPLVPLRTIDGDEDQRIFGRVRIEMCNSADERVHLGDEMHVAAVDGSLWKIHVDVDGKEADGPQMRAFIVSLGSSQRYTSNVFGCAMDLYPCRALLVEEYEAGKFHKRSYFILDVALKSFIERCGSHTFCLGGRLQQTGRPVLYDPGSDEFKNYGGPLAEESNNNGNEESKGGSTDSDEENNNNGNEGNEGSCSSWCFPGCKIT